MQVVEKVDLHYKNKGLYHIKKDPMKIIVHYDTSVDKYVLVCIASYIITVYAMHKINN